MLAPLQLLYLISPVLGGKSLYCQTFDKDFSKIYQGWVYSVKDACVSVSNSLAYFPLIILTSCIICTELSVDQMNSVFIAVLMEDVGVQHQWFICCALQIVAVIIIWAIDFCIHRPTIPIDEASVTWCTSFSMGALERLDTSGSSCKIELPLVNGKSQTLTKALHTFDKTS